jgi:transglutaminase-like putative cysteine protease
VTQRARQLLEEPLLDAAALDLAAASRLTYVLRQTFRYDYDRPVHDLRQRLVVVPAARHGSARRLLAGLTASAPDAVVVSRRHRTGTVVVTAELDVVPESVEFTLEAVVERRGAYRDHQLPVAAASHPRWLRPTRLTAADDAVRALAAPLRGGHPLDVAEAACVAVHAAMPYEYGVTSPRTTASEALAAGRGVCQDHAHVMLAILRSAGVAARYVSGHLLGEGGTHAWVEVLVPDGDGTRAVAMDPCNGCRVDARYLTVATGRDYLDVAPTSGSYSGDAVGRLTATKRVGLAEAA